MINFNYIKMTQEFRKVTHCLFDMDGLLLNTSEVYTQISKQILDEQRSTVKHSNDFKLTVMGNQAIEGAKKAVTYFKLSMSPEQFVARQHEIALDLMPTAELLPGVEKLLLHLSSYKIPIALATSAGEEMYKIKTTRHTKIFDLFDHKVFGSSDDEVVYGKPAPDIFLVAARRFPDQPDPSKCLVFEDAPNGVQAAIAAGCQVVMVPPPFVTKDMRKEATLAIDSMEQFEPELFGLPPYNS